MGILAFLTIVRNEIRLKDQRITDRLEEARRQRDKRAQAEKEQGDDEEPISIQPEGYAQSD